MLRVLFAYLIVFTCFFTASAQKEFYKLSPISLNNLDAFLNPPENWKVVGEIQGSFNESTPVTKKGAGILFNDFKEGNKYKEDANLFSKFEHSDMFLAVDFMIPKGSNSGIYFQGRYEIQLFDSWLNKVPRASDCGGIYERWDESRTEGSKGYEGHAPRVNASFAPNVWQHLEIEFQAPRFDNEGKKIKPARFVKVVLNGIVIHENVILWGPTRAAKFTDEKPTGPLMIQGDHGVVAFRNMHYAILGDFKADIQDLQYVYYEGKFNEFTELTPGKITRQGKADAIDVKLADDPNALALVFTGKINVHEETEYQFILKKHGKLQMKLDNAVVISPSDYFQDDIINKHLSTGIHTFEIAYIKNFTWAAPGIGLYVGKSNSRPVPLHATTSLPAVAPSPLISVKQQGEVEIIRSYLAHNNRKKTHVISVGNPNQVHYSYDLDNGALLQVWRGDFLNVTDMWYERGEPQTAASLGATLVLPGIPAVSSAGVVLPDTLNYLSEFIYKGYELRGSGVPVFTYQYNSVLLNDTFQPLETGQGITRTLSLSGQQTQPLIIRIAKGNSIIKIDKNIFAVDNRYFITVPEASKVKPEIKKSGEMQELVLPANSLNSVQYSIIW